MTYVTLPNGTTIWENASQIFVNVTNSTSPVGAAQAAIKTTIPWFWPLFPFVLYIYLIVEFADSPTGGKLYMIALLAFMISAFLALGGYISDAVIQFVIFIGAFYFSKLLKSLGG